MTTKMENFTIESLQKELDRRVKMNRIKTLAPKMKKNPDFTTVMEMAQDIVDDVVNDEHSYMNEVDYIYEEVMISCFGKDFFHWYNKMMD